MPQTQSSKPFPSWTFQSGTGRFYLALELWDTGNGLQGLLTGGEKPHIGGVVLAVPRPSLSGEGWSADLYLTPVPNHKDIDFASPLADSLARLSHFPVVMTAGVHSDSFTPEEIKHLKTDFTMLMQQALQELEDYFSSNANK
ncbi:hypothetical protein [Desulfitobacterium sp.]|uniref:prenylated flavin chaperone LpdD n=1 Tax=Desulfitobacterium sp. TaxID=49981 RepID=UPI002D7E621C|nr:hypothetical protein [Desulfitobacterium sp.]